MYATLIIIALVFPPSDPYFIPEVAVFFAWMTVHAGYILAISIGEYRGARGWVGLSRDRCVGCGRPLERRTWAPLCDKCYIDIMFYVVVGKVGGDTPPMRRCF